MQTLLKSVSFCFMTGGEEASNATASGICYLESRIYLVDNDLQSIQLHSSRSKRETYPHMYRCHNQHHQMQYSHLPLWMKNRKNENSFRNEYKIFFVKLK